MNPRPEDAGLGPVAPDPGDDRDLAARVAAEPVAATDAEAVDAYSALAALLLDAHAARAARGDSPTSSSESLRPDVPRQKPRPSPRAAGEEAA